MTCWKEKKYNKEKTIFQNAPNVRLLYIHSLVYSGLIGSGFLAMHVNQKWPFCNLGQRLDQIFGEIVSAREKTPKNTSLVV